MTVATNAMNVPMNAMKAVEVFEAKKCRVIETAVPDIQGLELLVQVRATGLCGSDILRINTFKESDYCMKPVVLGHEFMGIVKKAPGTREGRELLGRRVTANPLIYSQNVGTPHDITGSVGKTRQGSFAQFLAIDQSQVRIVPDNIQDDVAACTDVLACAINAQRLLDAHERSSIAIIGDGPLAFATSIYLADKGYSLTLAGKHQEKRINALGAREIQFINKDEMTSLRSESFDRILEAVGGSQSDTIAQAIRLVKPHGKIVVAGVFSKGYEGTMDFRSLFYKEATLVGANSYNADDFDAALDCMSRPQIHDRLATMVSHSYALTDFNKGLGVVQDRANTTALKVIYRP